MNWIAVTADKDCGEKNYKSYKKVKVKVKSSDISEYFDCLCSKCAPKLVLVEKKKKKLLTLRQTLH